MERQGTSLRSEGLDPWSKHHVNDGRSWLADKPTVTTSPKQGGESKHSREFTIRKEKGAGGIRTPEIMDLQSIALGHLATAPLCVQE